MLLFSLCPNHLSISSNFILNPLLSFHFLKLSFKFLYHTFISANFLLNSSSTLSFPPTLFYFKFPLLSFHFLQLSVKFFYNPFISANFLLNYSTCFHHFILSNSLLNSSTIRAFNSTPLLNTSTIFSFPSMLFKSFHHPYIPSHILLNPSTCSSLHFTHRIYNFSTILSFPPILLNPSTVLSFPSILFTILPPSTHSLPFSFRSFHHPLISFHSLYNPSTIHSFPPILFLILPPSTHSFSFSLRSFHYPLIPSHLFEYFRHPLIYTCILFRSSPHPFVPSSFLLILPQSSHSPPPPF